MPIHPIMGEYDEMRKIGNTTVLILYPRISKEENERRQQEINRICGRILRNEATRRMKKAADSGK
jgi:hypothetical protein